MLSSLTSALESEACRHAAAAAAAAAAAPAEASSGRAGAALGLVCGGVRGVCRRLQGDKVTTTTDDNGNYSAEGQWRVSFLQGATREALAGTLSLSLARGWGSVAG